MIPLLKEVLKRYFEDAETIQVGLRHSSSVDLHSRWSQISSTSQSKRYVKHKMAMIAHLLRTSEVI